MDRKFTHTSMLVGIIGFFGTAPLMAQDKPVTDPVGATQYANVNSCVSRSQGEEVTDPVGATHYANAETTDQSEIRALRTEMERLQQRIEQLEKRPVTESHPSGAASAPATSVTTQEGGWPEFLNHFKLSTLIYGDWASYPRTGWGPQFLTQLNPPGPGNDGFNSFDLTRTYLNFLWTPNDRYTLRITPNIFREVGTASAFNNSSRSSVGSNINGNLTFRLKYGWLQRNNVFYEGQNIRIGQIENPLVPWEEDLYGFRFVNLVPLNFFAYSSTDLGVAAFGPIRLHEVKYGDYWAGVYNGSSFHAAEYNEKRSPQGRLTLCPFAANPALTDLCLTGFGSYGYTNVSPDTKDAVVRRLAGLVHYSAQHWGLAFEFDETRNNNTVGNFFSGSGPLAQVPDPITPGKTIANPVLQVYNSILNPKAIARGYSLFGHWDIGATPFTLFGMWTRWYPNIHVAHDPLDSDRVVAGVAYRVNDWLRIALDSQNFIYLNHGPRGQKDIHAIFTNFEINYN
jgi:hypothetical protein